MQLNVCLSWNLMRGGAIVRSKIDNDAYCVCTHDFSLCTHRKFGPVRTMYAVKISGTQTFFGFMRTQIKKKNL